jgi:hypothetical protein
MSTQLISVTCNHCGGPLQVPDATRFVTCSYCGTRLEVHRSGNAVYTEVLASIDQRTQAMAQDLEHIKRQNEIERLDREWQMRRSSLMVHNKDGSVSEPSAVGSIIGSVITAVIGVFVMAAAPGEVKFVGLLFIVIGVVSGLVQMGKAAQYRDAEESYRRQRDALMRSNQNEQ